MSAIAIHSFCIMFAVCSFLGISKTYAQTLTIVNLDSSREAIVLEASLTRFLRDTGHAIQGSGIEGYVVLLHAMGATSKEGTSLGIVGSATVTRVLQTASVASLLPDVSRTNHEFIQKFAAVMGSPVIYLASSTAIGGNIDAVAELLGQYIATVIRRLSTNPQDPLWTVEHNALTYSGANPIR